MPLTNGDVVQSTTRDMIFKCLEKRDDKDNFYWWSAKELAKVAGVAAGTVHHHINSFRHYNVLRVEYDKKNKQTPVYKIDPLKYNKYIEVKDKINSGEIKTSERRKLRKKK
jgi:hypothetical protein